MEPTFLSALALRFFRNSSQAECRLQPGILPLEDLYLVETLLRRILPPVATLLLEGPQLVVFCLQSGILLLHLLLVIPVNLLPGIHLLLLLHLLHQLHQLHPLLALPPLPLETLATLSPGTFHLRLSHHWYLNLLDLFILRPRPKRISLR